MKLYRNLQPKEHEPTSSDVTSLDALLSTQTAENFYEEDDDFLSDPSDGELSDKDRKMVYGSREEDISHIAGENPTVAEYEAAAPLSYFGNLYEDDESELTPPKYHLKEIEEVEYFSAISDGVEKPELDEELLKAA